MFYTNVENEMIFARNYVEKVESSPSGRVVKFLKIFKVLSCGEDLGEVFLQKMMLFRQKNLTPTPPQRRTVPKKERS